MLEGAGERAENTGNTECRDLGESLSSCPTSRASHRNWVGPLQFETTIF
jgi:hypothetical protein